MDSLSASPPVRSTRCQPTLEKQQDKVSGKITSSHPNDSPTWRPPARSAVPLHKVVRPVLKRSGLESMSIPVHSSFGEGTSSYKLSADFNKASGRNEHFSDVARSALPPGMPVPSVDIARLPSREMQQQTILDTIARLEVDRGLDVDYNGPSVKVSPRTTHMAWENLEEDGTLTPSRRRGGGAASDRSHSRHRMKELTNIPSDCLSSLPPSPRRPEVPGIVSAFQAGIRERERILRQPALLNPAAVQTEGGLTFTKAGRNGSPTTTVFSPGFVLPQIGTQPNLRSPAAVAQSQGSTRSLNEPRGGQGRIHTTGLKSLHDAPTPIDTTHSMINDIEITVPTIDGVEMVVEGGDDEMESLAAGTSRGHFELNVEQLAFSRQTTTVVEDDAPFSTHVPTLPKKRKEVVPTAPLITNTPAHGIKGGSLRSVREQLEWHMTTSAKPLMPPPESSPKLRATVVDPKGGNGGGGPAYSPRRRQSSIATSGFFPASRRASLLSKSESASRYMEGSVASGGGGPENSAAVAESIAELRRNEEKMLNSDQAPALLVRAVGPAGGDRHTKEAVYALSTPRGTRDLFVPAPPSATSQQGGTSPGAGGGLMPQPSNLGWGSSYGITSSANFSRHATAGSPSFRAPGGTGRTPRARGNSTSAANFMTGGRLTASNAASPMRNHPQHQQPPSLGGAASLMDSTSSFVTSNPHSNDAPHSLGGVGGGGLGGSSALASVIPPISHAGAHSSTALQPIFKRARPMAVVYATSSVPMTA